MDIVDTYIHIYIYIYILYFLLDEYLHHDADKITNVTFLSSGKPEIPSINTTKHNCLFSMLFPFPPLYISFDVQPLHFIINHIW